MRTTLTLCALLLATSAHAVTLRWTNIVYEDYGDSTIRVRETIDSVIVYSTRWDACGPGCGGETVLARLSVRGREGMPEVLIVPRIPGVYCYRARTKDRAGNLSWASNESSYDERPGSLARTAIEPEAVGALPHYHLNGSLCTRSSCWYDKAAGVWRLGIQRRWQ